MRVSRSAHLALALAALALAPAAARAAALQLVTEDYPPFNFQEDGAGPVTGICTDLLAKAMKDAGVEAKVTLMPWARAYAQAQKDAGTCVYSTTRTPEREALFKWVGPLVRNDWTLFGRADSPKVATLADVKAFTVGGYQADALTEYLKAQGLKVDEAASDAANPRKLAAKRIDFWASGKSLGPYLAKREGVAGIVPVLTIKETEMYLACNKGVPDDVVRKLDAALKKLAKDGAAAAINAQYAK